jgi:hypothetical protein
MVEGQHRIPLFLIQLSMPSTAAESCMLHTQVHSDTVFTLCIMKRCPNSGDLVGLEQQPRKSRSIDIAQLFKKGRSQGSFDYDVADESPESESCDVDDASDFAIMMAKLCSMDDDRDRNFGRSIPRQPEYRSKNTITMQRRQYSKP